MFRNYFKIPWRHLIRDRQFTILNILGLSTGLACAFLIFLWVNDERHVDTFHEKGNRLFQVMEREKSNEGISVSYRTSGLTAQVLKAEMPEVEFATAVMSYSWFPKFLLSPGPEKKLKAVGQFTDNDFFNVFSYPLISGDKKRVLEDKNSIVISERLASKLFDETENALGKILEWELSGYRRQVVVSGVFKNVPSNSSQQFDFLLSFESFKEISPSVIEWGNNGTNAYVVLKKGTDLGNFSKKISGFIKSKRAETDRTLFLSKYSDNYLYGKYENGVQVGGRIVYVRLFTIVSIFILLIACINFMNLSTAKASMRLKEVGVKKVIGAARSSLILQFVSESVLMALLSLVNAAILVAVLLPEFNSLTSKNIILEWDSAHLAIAIFIALVTGIVSGSYPAFYLSGFNPISVLKGKLRTYAGELWIRKGLVVFQFTLSVVFIISVIVIYRQIQLIQTKNLGYDKDNIMYFTKDGRIQENPEIFLSQLKKIPGVIDASSTDHLFTGGFNTTGGLEWPGKTPGQEFPFEIMHTSYDMIDLLGIKIKEGRSFSPEFGADSSKIIFNEAAIKMMGLTNPVGKVIRLWGMEKEIVGVAKDFHFASLHEKVKPLFLLLDPKNTHYVIAKITAGKENEVLTSMKKLYGQFNPGSPFDYRFLDEDYQALYSSEQRVASLSRWFAGLAILISCLGLFGLAAFTAQRRQKEIGIRKVVGASVTSVVVALSREFLRLVLIAVLIAFPLSWWVMNQWLNDFAYRTSINVDVFIIAGLSTILITLVTVSFQSIKAAIVNPVKSLRSE